MHFLLLLLTLLFVSCSPSFREAVLVDQALRQHKKKSAKRFLSSSRKVENQAYEVYFPLILSSESLIEGDGWHSGVLWYDDLIFTGYGKRQKEQSLGYSVEHVLKVQYVSPLFPVFEQGLREGDTLLELEGEEVSSWTRKDLSLALDNKWKHAPGKDLACTILREKEKKTFYLRPLKVAPFSLKLLFTDHVYAFVNGRSILLTEGMVRYAKSAQNLSYVLSYALARNLLNQPLIQAGQTAVGMALDVASFHLWGLTTFGGFGKWGEGFRAKEMRLDAEYLSLLLSKSIGFDLSDAPYFWEKMEREHPKHIALDFFYPYTSAEERFHFLQAAVQEIEYQELLEKKER